MRDVLFGVVSPVREETHACGSLGGFCDAAVLILNATA
jgi:hypothetical protein